MRLKYNSVRTWSSSCQRWFASKAEAIRGQELFLTERAGVISHLEYQPRFILSKTPRITITLDFAYLEDGQRIYEEVKGVMTGDFRTKLAWLKEKYSIDVKIVQA